MKLLVITQKVNKDDDVLGFFHRWLIEFSQKVESLTVICLEKGEYDLPKNVKVLSLGKESGVGRFGYIKNLFKYLWSERKGYDTVFVHMNPIYLVVAGWFLKILRKPMYLWYTHHKIDFKLKIAILFVEKVFSASPRSFTLKKGKLKILGHGIDTKQFSPVDFDHKEITALTVGRITPIKKIDIFLEALSVLHKKGLPIKGVIVGDVVYDSDVLYKKRLEKYIENNDMGSYVEFKGSIPNSQMRDEYAKSNIMINLSGEGSFDKAVLEAMSMDIQVVTSNPAFSDILEGYICENSVDSLVSKIEKTVNKPVDDLREYVVEGHSVENLINRLINEMYE